MLVALSALTVVACGKMPQSLSEVFEHWNSANEPNLLNTSAAYERNLSKLPLTATLNSKPWSDSYWPSNEGGISARWNTSNPQNFSYTSPSLAKLKTMSQADLAELSPAEKYDIFMGRYDYPTVASERARTSPNDESWEGICHGWASAAYLYQEPKPVVLQNSEGLSVPFGSSDIKALLSYHQGQVAVNVPTRFLASRCNADLSTNPGAALSPECKDVNAGSFHIVLSNQISRNLPFVADVTRDLQVWNQPVYAYKSSIIKEQLPSAGAAAGTKKEVVVQTSMTYGLEVEPQWQDLRNNQLLGSKTYLYRLELSDTNEIIGGEWMSQERPDFLWSQNKPSFDGYFAGLDRIYQASLRGGVPTPLPTVSPTSIPSPQPTAVPTALPTAVPTVVPTALPLPLPTRFPLPPSSQEGVCPTGWATRTVPGSDGATYCAAGSKVLGPVSEKMIDACLNAFNEDCYEPSWNESTYLKFRGNDRCLPGTAFDFQTGYCAQKNLAGNGTSVFGPFSNELVGKCFAANGGQACSSMRWDRNLVLSLLVR